MLAILVSLLLSFQPSSKIAEKPAEPDAIVIRGDTPQAMCDLIYETRKAEIDRVSAEMDGLTSRNDWNKLSPEAQEKLKKPYRAKLESLRKNRAIQISTRVPWDVAVGELFTMPEVKVPAKKWRMEARADKNTVLVFCDVTNPRTPKRKEFKHVVLEDVPGLPAKITAGKPIDTDGLWQRIDDIKVEGATYPRFRRWPNESEVKKMWPKYLTEKESAAK